MTAPDRQAVRGRLHRSLAMLLDHDEHLFRVKAGERAVTARLMHYLIGEFPYWDVDAEYNKNFDKVKEIEGIATEGHPTNQAVPDLIVHRRDTKKNLLIVEAKWSAADVADDHEKLMGATRIDSKLAYEFGAHVVLSERTIQWFENGAAVDGPEPFGQ